MGLGLALLFTNASFWSNNSADWDVVFQDEFSGNSLNRNLWDTKFKWGERFLAQQGHLQCYVDRNAIVEDGNLVLLAEDRPVSNKLCDNQEYASAMISSHNSLELKYGYVEMRADMATGHGFWNAFWMMPNIGENTPGGKRMEIDIVETVSRQPDRANLNYHWRDPDTQENGTIPTSVRLWGTDLTKGFHTYAVDWEPRRIRYYVDGILRKTVTEDSKKGLYLPDRSMYIIASLPIGGPWAQSPKASTPFPGKFEIDYIRALQRSHSSSDFDNLMRNPGFESRFSYWSKYGSTKISGNEYSGSRAVEVNRSGANQVVSNLKRHTLYRYSGFVKSLDGSNTMLGVKDYGGSSQLFAHHKSKIYEEKQVFFSTGNSTKATVFCYNANGRGLCDDLQLIEVPNLLDNSSFEDGSRGWSYNNSKVVSGSRSGGSKQARLTGQSGVNQTVTGLKPYTLYRFSGYIKSLDGSSSMIGVKDYGGDQKMNWTKSADYNFKEITFMTGNTDRATIFFYQEGGKAVGDDFSLRVAE